MNIGACAIAGQESPPPRRVGGAVRKAVSRSPNGPSLFRTVRHRHPPPLPATPGSTTASKVQIAAETGKKSPPSGAADATGCRGSTAGQEASTGGYKYRGSVRTPAHPAITASPKTIPLSRYQPTRLGRPPSSPSSQPHQYVRATPAPPSRPGTRRGHPLCRSIRAGPHPSQPPR
jgi:hypothetical protein